MEDLTKGFKYKYKGELSDKEVDEALERMRLKPKNTYKLVNNKFKLKRVGEQ